MRFEVKRVLYALSGFAALFDKTHMQHEEDEALRS